MWKAAFSFEFLPATENRLPIMEESDYFYCVLV